MSIGDESTNHGSAPTYRTGLMPPMNVNDAAEHDVPGADSQHVKGKMQSPRCRST